jgi:predicted RNase H-related nuclease YkuK (DUF458 family)
MTKTDTKRTWYEPDSDGCNKLDDEQLLQWIKKSQEKLSREGKTCKLVIGTDSHTAGVHFRFVTSVCLLTQGSGGFYYYTTAYESKLNYKKNHQFRMFAEVQKSVDLADFFLEHLGLVSEIHIDASPKEANEFTSPFSDSLKGMVLGSGYQCEIKPLAWAANCVSDRHTR